MAVDIDFVPCKCYNFYVAGGAVSEAFYIMQVNPKGSAVSPRALKVSQAASYLGVSTISIRRLITRGLIKPNRALRHLLIPVAELERFLGGRQQ
jgi:excisionase family DNA binding protein